MRFVKIRCQLIPNFTEAILRDEATDIVAPQLNFPAEALPKSSAGYHIRRLKFLPILYLIQVLLSIPVSP